MPGFQKLEPEQDKQTDRHSGGTYYHAALVGGKSMLLGSTQE